MARAPTETSGVRCMGSRVGSLAGLSKVTLVAERNFPFDILVFFYVKDKIGQIGMVGPNGDDGRNVAASADLIRLVPIERQGDPVGQRGNPLMEADLQDGCLAVGLDTLTDPFIADSVEGDHGVAIAGAVDRDQVMGFLGIEGDRGGSEFLRTEKGAKIRHGLNNRNAMAEGNRKGCPGDPSQKWKKLLGKPTRNEKEAPLLAAPLFRLIKLQTTN